MPEKPKQGSGSRILNIMAELRGNFDFRKSDPVVQTQAVGTPELIPNETKSKILTGAFRAIEPTARTPVNQASVLGIVQSSLSKVGSERLENRKILDLMPEVDKAARLMIASTLAPNDLTRQEIPVTFDCDDIEESKLTELSDKATSFFQKKLNLKTSAASWIYQWGYEAGACIYAIIPLRSFEKIQDDSYLGMENFISKVIEPLAQESLFGFGNDNAFDQQRSESYLALETFSHQLISETLSDSEKKAITDRSIPTELKTIIGKMIGQESLALTDNPSILQANDIAKEKRKVRTDDILRKTYRKPTADTVLSVSASREAVDDEPGVIGNPIFMRLPPESVTVIHTPGDPNDHQGYFILLDRQGNPINSVAYQEDNAGNPTNYNANQGDVFSQVYNAYGLSTGSRGASNEDTMSRIYTHIVSEHLKNRLTKAGYSNISIGNVDSVFRCMFSRFVQAKQTRVLFMPKDLVSYMTFEMDQNGYGVSRLDRIKFNLGMKMAVQVSKVLAAIKAAMDRRKIEIKFTENMLEQPEQIFQTVIREYLNKSTMSFSIDPNEIQNQIADKSVSIKGIDIPGMEQFDLTNEPDQRTSSVDFDPEILSYLDKQINNGLHVPASTMNSLSEDEYARSVTTTNLFFAMDVSIDQDIVIKCISDCLRKYARYSEEFQNEIYKIAPSLKNKSKPTEDNSSIESTEDNKKKEAFILPDYYTIDKLIDSMIITLPHPNVAPSKAQFEALDGMITSITNTVNALFPDDFAGSDDSLAPTIRLLRAKFTALNIRNYLEGSGMSTIDIPDNNFTDVIGDIDKLTRALQNVSVMIKDKAKIVENVEPGEDPTTGTIPGYA